MGHVNRRIYRNTIVYDNGCNWTHYHDIIFLFILTQHHLFSIISILKLFDLSNTNPINNFQVSLFVLSGYIQSFWLSWHNRIFFIQIELSTTESWFLLQPKRQFWASNYRLLNNKSLLEIFLENSYASIITKLSTSPLLSKHHQQPINLCLLNKLHLKEYCRSLNRCEYSKQILEDTIITNKNKSLFIVWNNISFKEYRLIRLEDMVCKNNPYENKFKKAWMRNALQNSGLLLCGSLLIFFSFLFLL
jgi:hypothetical protein